MGLILDRFIIMKWVPDFAQVLLSICMGYRVILFGIPNPP